jgi:hypothetical protein
MRRALLKTGFVASRNFVIAASIYTEIAAASMYALCN